MKKIFLLLSLLLINNVSALTLIPNDNTTDTFHYSNNTFIDTVYQLNNSDSLSKISITFDALKTYGFGQSYYFKDVHNNSLVIQFTYFVSDISIISYTIHRNVTAFYNNKPLLLEQKTFGLHKITGYELDNTALSINIFSNQDTLINIIDFTASHIDINNNLFPSILILPNRNDVEIFLSNPIYINRIELPSSTNSYTFTQINIDYNDNGISKLQNELDINYNSLSMPFKFIFLLFKGLLLLIKTVTLGYAISDIDFYQYQIWFITPLQYIDFIIGLFFNVLKFISMMGIIWIFIVVECFIIIYNYIQSRDILQTINKSFEMSFNIWNYIIFKPLNWIFTKLLLFWTGK